MVIMRELERMFSRIDVDTCGTWRRFTAAVLMVVGVSVAAADFDAGLEAADRGDYAQAMRNWLPLAKQGYPTAQFNVALLYQNGWGVARDPGEAVMWYWAAAAQGDLGAQFNLAGMYAAGDGMPPTPVEAYAWYDVATKGGHPEAAAARDAVASGLDDERRAQARALAGVLWDKYGSR
jgi:TPR repeat protein